MKESEELQIGEIYETYRPLLMAIAYRMLGSAEEAEDIVQDLFLRLQDMDMSKIGRLKPYLCRMVSNRCLNELKSARKRREQYLGPWLPEPWPDAPTASQPENQVEREEAVTYAILVLLERLSPLERVVYVLREAFAFSYSEIAETTGRTEAGCRQLFSRGQRKLQGGGQQARGGPELEREGVRRIAAAFLEGDVDRLSGLLADDALLYTDGGGQVRAAVNPIIGPDRIVTLLRAASGRRLAGAKVSVRAMNGGWGILFEKDGRLAGVLNVDWTPGRETVRNMYLLLNPLKLDRLSFP